MWELHLIGMGVQLTPSELLTTVSFIYDTSFSTTSGGVMCLQNIVI